MTFLDHLPPSVRVGGYFKQLTDRVMAQIAEAWPDLTVNQVRLLIILDHPLPMKELAETLNVTPSNLTPLVAQCRKQGLVEKTRSEQDARSVLVKLTVAGRARRDEIIPQISSFVCKQSGLDEAVYAQILALIHDVEHSLLGGGIAGQTAEDPPKSLG